MHTKKIVAVALASIGIANVVLMVLGRISQLMFWMIILALFIISKVYFSGQERK